MRQIMSRDLLTPRVKAWTAPLTVAVLIALASACAHAAAASAASPGYHSPGYAGNTNFGAKVTPTALPPIVLGTGKYPDLLVDAAGTAHVVFAHDGGTSAADTYSVCNLQRGIKQCATSPTVPAPVAPDSSQGGIFSGNSPNLDHDFDGPVPLDIGNQLFVIDRRFPENFPTPAGPTSVSDSNVFEWSSSDGGATLTGPGDLGDNQMSGGAIAYGDPNAASVGTISRTETGGTFFQGTAPGSYTTAQAQLGAGDQAYDGELALDGTRPVATFADLSGNVFVREYSGQGDINDPANWSESSFHGYSPQIIGGAAGVFVLSSDGDINDGHLSLRRIVGGQATGAAIAMGQSMTAPAISEDASGRISFAYTDKYGLEVRSSLNGIAFSGAQLAAALPSGTGIGHLVVAAAADGGGFATFVKNPVGAEGIGQIVVSAFGTQAADGLPGLGPLPGGGIGSAVGDQLATSTCSSATFGVVDAEIYPAGAGCFAHDPSNPNLDVTLGTLNLNGLQIIPDPGVRIGIDFRQHTIDTTGPVRVVLTAGGVNITLFHGALHIQCPDDGPGDTLVDFKPSDLTNLLPAVQGFPIDGDIDIKLAKGGVDIPISLKMPGAFGGITGAATLHADTRTGLDLKSLEFTVGDLNLAALELKNLDVSYTEQGDVWKGSGQLLVPAGGAALDAAISVEFDKGDFTKGSLEVVPGGYPGIPLDDDDPPPMLYFSHAGLSLGLSPLTLTGDAGIGVLPLKPKGVGSSTDYAIRLEAQLSAAFGAPVTFTATAQGFLYQLELAQAKFVYTLPDQVSLNASAGFDLGFLAFKGQMAALIDPTHGVYSADLKADVVLDFSLIPNIDLSGFELHVDNQGFGFHVCAAVCGGVSFEWDDPAPVFTDDSPWASKLKPAQPGAAPAAEAGADHEDAVSAGTFTVPTGAPSASLVVHGAGGAPSVVLVAPGGQQITPALGGSGDTSQLLAAAQQTTYVGIKHPKAGRWSVLPAPGSTVAISSVEDAIGQPAPTIRATVSGHGPRRVVHYHATMPTGVTIALAEQNGHLLHRLGTVHGGSGTIAFQPAFGPGGKRQLVAEISDNGAPQDSQTLASYTVPAPAKPGPAKRLRVRAVHGAFNYSFSPSAHAVRTLIAIDGSDGRHLQRLVAPGVHHGSVPAIGYGDAVTVTVRGVRVDGVKGPVVSASARITPPTVKTKHRKHHRPEGNKHKRPTHHASG
jgi:hypothetical protein